MATLFQPQESSRSIGKRIFLAIVILAVLGIALWAGLDMALRLTAGRS